MEAAGKPVTIMLVDDEVPFVETMSKRLGVRQYEIISAFSGEEALRKLEENVSIEVVILDVKMPGMDGIETLTHIRKKYPLVEVIMLTGHGTVESAVEGMRQGSFDFLMKPCDIDQLTAKVEKAAARKREQEMKILHAELEHIRRSGKRRI